MWYRHSQAYLMEGYLSIPVFVDYHVVEAIILTRCRWWGLADKPVEMERIIS